MSPRPGRLRRAARAACLAALPGCLAAVAALAQSPLVSAIEATYLVKFGAFVEWPAGVFASATSPFHLCVTGDHPFGGVLDQAAAGGTVDQHPVAVRRLAAVTRNSDCQILFIGAGGAVPIADILAAVRGEPVLTVTALPADGPDKGIVNFVIQNNHVRFEIDPRRAAEDGLRISSQLLALAVNLRSR